MRRRIEPPEATPRPRGSLGYGCQFIDQDDVDAVVAVLRGERLTQGPAAARFEAGLCRFTGAEHAVAVSNGTAALELAYRALGVGPGTRVVTSPNTFLATATTAISAGAEVDFVDVEPRTGNLDLGRLEERLTDGRPPDVVCAVHFAGFPCDMQRLIDLRREHGFKLVEDAAHALGARYRVDERWWSVGEHPEVDAAILSFHPVKHITTAEGGAVLSNDEELAQRIRLLREHGVERDGPGTAPRMVALGMNARMSDLHAALGTSQLKKLPDFLAARREIAMRYIAELRDYELLDPGSADREHAWHLFVIRAEEEEREALMRDLARRGIHTQIHYHPVPAQPWFVERCGERRMPNAEHHARRAVSLPIFPALSDADQGRVIETLHVWRRRRAAA